MYGIVSKTKFPATTAQGFAWVFFQLEHEEHQDTDNRYLPARNT